MANQKVYTIQINGLTESISAVESLNKQLDNLDKRINALQSQNIKLNTSSGGKSALTEEEAVQREINKLKKEGETLDAKIAATQDEIYKKVDATKQLYKETVADQKAMAAEERLIADTYSNTMQGMKSHLADLKAAINVTDLGDTDKINQMTKEANELTNKLKEMEQAYGTFGRNVGNYQDAANGFKGLRIEVAGATQEFDNAKQAAKTLKQELATLQVKKDQGMLLSEEELKRFNELPSIVAQLQSSIQDAGKPMDNIMDTMQSIVALAQTGKGLAAFFGFDSDEIEKSIQKLVALQNAMQGLQTISKQLKSGEGIGGWLKSASSSMDAFAASITKTDKAAKALSLSLKVLSGIAILATIIALTKALSDYTKKQKEASKATEDGLKAYAKTESELSILEKRLNDFVGSKKQEKKLVEELNSKYGSSLGQYRTLAEWKTALAQKGKVLCQVMQKEAEMQAILNLYTENYIKLQKAKKAQDEGNQDTVDLILKAIDGQASIRQVLASIKDDFMAPLTNDFNNYNEELEREKTELENNGKDLLNQAKELQEEINKLNADNKLFDYADQIDKNTSKTKKSVEDSTKTITELELRLMKDGLNKKLRQLDEEERQTLNKLKGNSRKTSDEIRRIQESYARLREKEIQEYLKKLEESINASAEEIKKIQFELDLSKVDNQIDELQNKFDKLSMDKPIINTLISQSEIKEISKSYNVDEGKMASANTFNQLFQLSEATNEADEYYKFLTRYIKEKDKTLFQDIADYNEAIFKETNEEQKQVYKKGLEDTFKKVSDLFENDYAKELLLLRNYTSDTEHTLEQSFERRLQAQKVYDETVRKQLIESIKEQSKLNKERINQSLSAATKAEGDRYSVQMSGLTAQRMLVEDGLKAIEKKYGEITKEGAIVVEESNKNISKKTLESYRDLESKLQEINGQILSARQQHNDKLNEITKEANIAIEKNEIDTAINISNIQEQYFNEQISNLRDFQSKTNEILSKQPILNNFGIVNLKETKKQFKELEDAARKTFDNIIKEKIKLEMMFATGFITPEAKNAITQQLNDLEAAFKQLFASIQTESKQNIPQFIQSCQVYVQAAMDSFQTIMNAVWDAQDNAFDDEQEQIDKDNEAIEEALDKQQEIVQQHKDAINDIEDELATSRGDRRQHLIDQLNAEIEAQRAAAAEEKRLQKEKEKQQAKQDELDRKRKKAQYHRDMLQAIVNGAMAVTYAAINAWPIPAIPMMALAGATTAAQLAIMASNKPYAKGGQLDGGVAVGNRHRDGGIKVLGGRAEIEGGEYVTNRLTTSKNLDLLEYVNSKKKRIDIADMLEFYNSGKPRKAIQNVRTKFEDGGYIPPLPTELDIKDQLRDIYIMQDNRPVWVSVVDINNKQADVRRVQTLAGLSE